MPPVQALGLQFDNALMITAELDRAPMIDKKLLRWDSRSLEVSCGRPERGDYLPPRRSDWVDCGVHSLAGVWQTRLFRVGRVSLVSGVKETLFASPGETDWPEVPEFYTALLLEREGFVCWGGVTVVSGRGRIT